MAGSQVELVCDDVDGVADDLGQIPVIVGAKLGDNVASQGVGVGSGVEFDGGEGGGTVEHDSGVGRAEHSVLTAVWSG
jgi:hypothetical protein